MAGLFYHLTEEITPDVAGDQQTIFQIKPGADQKIRLHSILFGYTSAVPGSTNLMLKLEYQSDGDASGASLAAANIIKADTRDGEDIRAAIRRGYTSGGGAQPTPAVIGTSNRVPIYIPIHTQGTWLWTPPSKPLYIHEGERLGVVADKNGATWYPLKVSVELEE